MRIEWSQGDTALALFGGNDLDLDIGGQIGIDSAKGGLHPCVYLAHERSRLPWLIERHVVFVAPKIDVLRQVLVRVAIKRSMSVRCD